LSGKKRPASGAAKGAAQPKGKKEKKIQPAPAATA